MLINLNRKRGVAHKLALLIACIAVTIATVLFAHPETVRAEPASPTATANSSGSDMKFTGWNTAPDGSGTAYQPGDALPNSNLDLYAQWKYDPKMLEIGSRFNETIKTLAAGTSTGYYDTDSLIQAVQVVDVLPPGSIATKDVSASNDGSYLAWWDADAKTIKLYSKSGRIVLNPDSSGLFSNCASLTTMNVSGWDTSQVRNMSFMFSNCASLATLDVSKWNTSRVTNMRYMFSASSKLTALDVSKWDTSHVTNMSDMFYDCSELATLDVSKWNTSSVTDMEGMFWDCGKLTPLDVSGWDTSGVTDMNYMFSYCKSLTTLDISNWNTSQVTNMSSMFNFCTGLTTLDVSGWDTSGVTNMSSMFYYCSKLATIYIGGGWNTDKVTSSSSMFYGCVYLPHFRLGVNDKTNANADPNTGYMKMADRFKAPYSVHFDKNAIDAAGTMGDEAFATGEKKALTANSYSRDGFAFLSWNTKANGTGRSFADGAEVSYLTAELSITLYAQWRDLNPAYSHTSNIDDNGTQNSNYGNNWTNANITGTDRGDSSKAHVVTLPDAKTIKVTITYGGESASYDYACVWEGSHPDYTAANNYSSSLSGKLGGGSHTSASNTKIYTIDGNAVTFGFESDVSGAGDGYGYYAVIEKVS